MLLWCPKVNSYFFTKTHLIYPRVYTLLQESERESFLHHRPFHMWLLSARYTQALGINVVTPIEISKYASSLLSYTLHYLATKVVGEFKLRAYSPLGSQRWPSSYNNISILTFSDKGWLQHLGIGCGVNSCGVVLGPVPWASFPFPSIHSSGNTPSPFCTAWCGGWGLLLWGVFPIGCHLQFLYHRHHSSWNVTEALHFTQTSIPWQGSHSALSLRGPRDLQPELPAMFSDSSILKAIN